MHGSEDPPVQTHWQKRPRQSPTGSGQAGAATRAKSVGLKAGATDGERSGEHGLHPVNSFGMQKPHPTTQCGTQRPCFGGGEAEAEDLGERGGDGAHLNEAERVRGGDAGAENKKRGIHFGLVGPVAVHAADAGGGRDEVAGDGVAGDEAGAQGDEERGAGKTAAGVEFVFGDDAVDAVGGIGGELGEEISDFWFRGGVVFVVKDDGKGASRAPDHSFPGFDLFAGRSGGGSGRAEFDEAGVAECHGEVQRFVGGDEAVIGNDADDGAISVGALDGSEDGGDGGVNAFEGCVALGAEGAGGVLLVVEGGEIDCGENGLLELDEARGKFGAVFVAGDGFVDAVGVRAEVFFERVEKAGRGEGAEKFAVVGRAGAPVLRKIPGDARGDADGPVNVGGHKTGIGGGVPKRGDFDVLGVPIPAAGIFPERIEGGVGVDAVRGGRDAGDERSVAGIGDGGHDAVNSRGVRALAEEAAQRGDFQSVGVGVKNVFGLEAVDGNENDGGTRGRFLCEGGRRGEQPVKSGE
jgi:hypothetical protein